MRLSALLVFIVTISFLTWLGSFSHPLHAAGNLENPVDVLSNSNIDERNVSHTISFTVPVNSQMVTTTDYIIVELTHFHDITQATALSGDYMGSPTITVDTNKVLITGIVILPGSNIEIVGITATNPSTKSEYTVKVIISEDVNGDIIKNLASFMATPFSGIVSISASIAPPVASLSISGYSAPGTFVTFSESGTVIGTDTAGGSNGYFNKFFGGLDPDTHDISLYGVDQSNRTTSPINIEIYTPIYQLTTISNLLLSPTVELNTSEIVQGTNLIVQGSTIPLGDVSVFTESPLRTYYTTATSDGNWDYTITNTNDYIPGDYRLYALVQNSGGTQSLFSNALQFTILPSSGPTPSPAACDVSHGDLNCDSHTNLTDFSILMYYWGSTSPAADINNDNLVNLVDFSIMMYYWGI